MIRIKILIALAALMLAAQVAMAGAQSGGGYELTASVGLGAMTSAGGEYELSGNIEPVGMDVATGGDYALILTSSPLVNEEEPGVIPPKYQVYVPLVVK
jgi:hypothetical protein